MGDWEASGRAGCADAADSCNSGRAAGDDETVESPGADCADGVGEDDAGAAVFVECRVARASDYCASAAEDGGEISGAEGGEGSGVGGGRGCGVSDEA